MISKGVLVTQTVILDKFIRYSKIKYKQYNDAYELEKNAAKDFAEKEAINKRQEELKQDHELLIKILDGGHCFGFSLLHAVMDILGKLEWWEALLLKVANWDEKEESLLNENTLPGSDPLLTDEYNKNKPYILTQHSLDHIIDRALYYIAFHQCSSNNSNLYYKPTEMYQSNILDPNSFSSSKDPQKQTSFLEYLKDGIIHTIQQRKKIAGNFSREQLLEILEDEQCKNSIIMVSNGAHAIRLGFDGVKWLVYDPNYNHTQPNQKSKALYFTGTKEECINEIISILGSAIGFDFASADPQRSYHFPAYEKLIQTNLASLFSDKGIFILNNKLPDELLTYLEKAEQSASLRDDIFEKCKNSFTKRFFSENGNCLSSLMKCHANFRKILKLAKASKHYEAIHENIMDALLHKDNAGKPPLIELCKNSPDNILNLLDFTVKDTASLQFMLDRFMDFDKEYKTAWDFLNSANKKIVMNFFIEKITGIKADYYAKVKTADKDSFTELLANILLTDRIMTLKKCSRINGRFYEKIISPPYTFPQFISDIADNNDIEQHLKNSTTYPYIVASHFLSKHIPQKTTKLSNLIIKKISGVKTKLSVSRKDKTQPFSQFLLAKLNKLLLTHLLPEDKKKSLAETIISEIAFCDDNIDENLNLFVDGNHPKKHEIIRTLVKYKPDLKLKLAYKILSNNILDLDLLTALYPPSSYLPATEISNTKLFLYAISKGHISAAAYFVENHMLSNYSNFDCGHALLDLCYFKEFGLAKKLIQELPHIDKAWRYSDSHDNTLHLAISHTPPDVELILMLYQDNYRAFESNTNDKFPLQLALDKQHFDLVDKIFKHKNIIEKHSEQQLCEVLKQLLFEKKYLLICSLLSQINRDKLVPYTKIIADETEESFCQLLAVLFNNKQYDVAAILLHEKNITNFAPSILSSILIANHSDEELKESLVQLIFHRQFELAKILLQLRPALISFKSSEQETILHVCAKQDNPNLELILKLYHENPSLAEINNGSGESALLILAKNGHFECIKQICQHPHIIAQHSAEQLNQLISILSENHQHAVITSLLQQNGSLTLHAIANEAMKTYLNKELFGNILWKKPLFNPQILTNALQKIQKPHIHFYHLVLFLKAFLDLPKKNDTFRLFKGKTEKNCKFIAEKILSATEKKPLVVSEELSTLINSIPEKHVLMQIIKQFNCILKIEFKIRETASCLPFAALQ